MNLLYLSQYYPPEIGAGAVRSKYISTFLANDSWNVDVVCEKPNYPNGILREAYINKWSYKEEVHEKLTIHRVWSAVNKRRNFFEQLWFYVSFTVSAFLYVLNHPKKYDLIYVSSPPIFIGITGVLLRKIIGSKFVFEVRDIWPDAILTQKSIKGSLLSYSFGQKLEKWIYSNADLIITVTESAEKIIKKRSGSTPVITIPNGVDIQLFNRKDQPEKTIDEFYDIQKFRVGYIGSLGFIHDLKTFVKAAKLCEDDPSIHFTIIGDGGRKNQLNDLIQNLSPNNLEWLGLKNHEKIPYYISSFDLAINPIVQSKAFESIITVKFYEYLACGTPVITCGNGSIEKIGNRSEAAITIEPENAELLAKTIKDLKSRPETLAKMSINGISFIRKNYSRETSSQKLSNELKILIENP